MRRAFPTLLVLASALVSVPLAAQEPPIPADSVGVGERVRVHFADGRPPLITRFQRLQPGVLVVRNADRADALLLELPAVTVSGLELSGGEDRGRGMAVGALLGAGAALGAGLVLQSMPSDGGANMAMAGAVIVGVPLGLLVGGAIGAANPPRAWQPVEWPPVVRSP